MIGRYRYLYACSRLSGFATSTGACTGTCTVRVLSTVSVGRQTCSVRVPTYSTICTDTGSVLVLSVGESSTSRSTSTVYVHQVWGSRTTSTYRYILVSQRNARLEWNGMECCVSVCLSVCLPLFLYRNSALIMYKYSYCTYERSLFQCLPNLCVTVTGQPSAVVSPT